MIAQPHLPLQKTKVPSAMIRRLWPRGHTRLATDGE
jgi:hypothetical protein